MSTARKVLMIIAFVVSIIATIGLAFCAFVFFVSSGNEELLMKALDGLNKKSLSPEDGKVLVIVIGVLLSILAVLELINALLSIKGAKRNSAGLMVLNIIFGIFAGIYINSLGGIFGLVSEKKEQEFLFLFYLFLYK